MPHVRSAVSALATAALVVSIGLGAPAANAATGDIAQFGLPDAKSAPVALTSDADGTLWVAAQGSVVLSKATLDGKVSTVLSGGGTNPDPVDIALGSDKRLWLTESTANRISAVTPGTGAEATYGLPTKDAKPGGIASGPDGNLWFTQFGGNSIARISTAGSITEFALAKDSGPTDIAAGPDGNLWFTMTTANAIGRITTGGAVTTYSLSTANAEPTGITAGPDGNLWFTERAGNRIGRITPKGLLAEFALPNAGSTPTAITAGPDKAVWFSMPGVNRIGRASMTGEITTFAVPTPSSTPAGISAGSDGNVWFVETDGNRLGRILTGVTPMSTAAPTVTGSSTAVGQVLSATSGTWNYAPTTYTYQWQRCASGDASSCANIDKANGATYTITADDAGKRVRVLVGATNLNGPAATPAPSNIQAIDGLPPTPPPAPVAGGQTVTIAAGVTAKLRGPKKTKRGVRRAYGVTFSDRKVQGTVRITLVNSLGTEVRVIARALPVKPNGKAARLAKIPRSVARGGYTLKAVYTPSQSVASTYAVATMTKPLTLR